MVTNSKLIAKLDHILKQYLKLRYETLIELDAEYSETKEHLPAPPEGGWKPIRKMEKQDHSCRTKPHLHC